MKKPLEYLEDYYGKLLNDTSSQNRLGWENKQAHYERFRVLTTEIDVNNRRLLDVGSGLGDLWQYLCDNGNNCQYIGVDLLPMMVNRARVRFPEIEFICGDVIAQPQLVKGPIDIVYTAGIFNLANTADYAFLGTAFDSFISIAGEYVVMSLLSIKSLAKESQYCYYDPVIVQNQLRRPGWESRIVEGYLHNDFTLIARRQTSNRG